VLAEIGYSRAEARKILGKGNDDVPVQENAERG
jgi:hypothetical protein